MNAIPAIAMDSKTNSSPADHLECLVYIGTYSGTRANPKGRGIYVCRLQTDTGSITSPGVAVETRDPSFLTIHPNHRFLYAVGEGGPTNGAVAAFAIDPTSGKLTLLDQQSSGGRGPCHLAVDRSGRCVLVANYGSGSVAALPIKPDGSLGVATAFIQHHGSSVNPKRQEAPHAHSVGFDPNNQRAFCADLGLDKLLIYQCDPVKAALIPNDPPSAALAPGAGPRHFAFSSDGRHVYVINELNCTITVFDYDVAHGSLQSQQTIPTLPATFTNVNTAAEIALHPNGKFLYGSNRGHNSIVVYAVDETTGKLTFLEHQSTLGKTPRNFGIDPTGSFLLAANQDSDNIVVFRIDPKTGRLTPTGQTLQVPSPVCVTFLAATP